MAEDGERLQTRSMAEMEKGADPNEGNANSPSQGQENTQENTQHTATTDMTQDPTDRLDDIDRYLRVSTKKVRTFWYIPDLKNTQLRDIAKNRLHHPRDPVKILINAPELRKFFPTSTFEICLIVARYTCIQTLKLTLELVWNPTHSS